jgi:UDP-glucose-4-epimerase GalE
MRILVTGGAGYIGCHTARQLRRHGHEPLIFDNLSTGHRFLAQGHDYILGDIADRYKLCAALRRVDAVMHFAAFSTVSESVRSPQKYFTNNLQAGLILLEEVLRARTPYFIFSSTCAVYGIPAQVPIRDDAPRTPIHPYGASKLALEFALEAYGAAHGLRFASLRYFNAAGADESGDIGELHFPESHLIPRALAAAAQQRPHFEIYGSDYPTPDGTCVRDYVHVNDLAAAHIRALDYLVAGGASTAFNLGTGKGSSVLEVLAVVEKVTGRTLEKQFCERRPGDPAVLVADAERAYRELQWRPERSLDAMVATAWNWMRRRPEESSERHTGPVVEMR